MNTDREQILKAQLSPDKVRVLEKYNLHLDDHDVWCSQRENAFTHRIVKHNYVVKNGILALVFRIYALCSAKLSYYRKNLQDYAPYRYDAEQGFVETELWDMEFLRHIPSDRFIDLRQLQQITDIDLFREFCASIEGRETPNE